jgi:hypothetical protein
MRKPVDKTPQELRAEQAAAKKRRMTTPSTQERVLCQSCSQWFNLPKQCMECSNWNVCDECLRRESEENRQKLAARGIII